MISECIGPDIFIKQCPSDTPRLSEKWTLGVNSEPCLFVGGAPPVGRHDGDISRADEVKRIPDHPNNIPLI